MMDRYLSYPIRVEDGENVRLRKQLFMVMYPFTLLVNAMLVFISKHQLGVGVAIAFVVASVLGHGHLLITRSLRLETVQGFVIFSFFGIVLNDICTAAEGSDRAWPLMVILLDVLLVTRSDKRLTKGLVVSVIVYLTVTTVESATRFGLFDLPGTISQADRREKHDCGSLPCAHAFTSIQNYAIYLLVFLLDYYFTRGFADSLLEEKVKVDASVETSEKIAGYLAGFDLDRCEVILSEPDAQLPEKLHEAFEKILGNLKVYRPFLPDALFDDTGGANSSQANSVLPPGTGGEDVAIVFTDIQSSTTLWEAYPASMKRALRTHNEIVRNVMGLYQGYEVKTIGDAFMVAFQTTSDAVGFSLAVQRRLVSSTWPTDLSENPLCKPDPEKIWNGPRVRIGLHCGSVEIELNSITGRFDYFGTTVNTASRVESASVGGGIAVTTQTLALLTDDDKSESIELPIGNVTLKGISGTVTLSILIPGSLAGRSGYIQSHYRSGNRSASSAESSHKGDAEKLPLTKLDHIPSASVAIVEVKSVNGSYDALNGRVCRILHVLDRCGGSVIGLVGARITLGWNISKRVLMHFDTSLRFLSMVMNGKYQGTEMNASLSTGSVLFTTLGTHGQRFVTALGDCLRLAHCSLPLCGELQVSALFTPTTADLRKDIRDLIRPVALIAAPKLLVTYQISLPRLLETDLTCVMRQDQQQGNAAEVGTAWGQEYWDAFATHNSEAVRRFVSEDPSLESVAVLLEGKPQKVCLVVS